MFSYEFCEISENTFFTENLRTTASAFGFSEVAAGGALWKRCSWKFCKIHRKTPLVCEIFKSNLFTEHLWLTASGFSLFRSSHRGSSKKKAVLENFAKFTGKHLWFAKFSKTPFLRNTPGGLLLAFSCNGTKMGYCQRCLENLRWIFVI